MRSTDTERDEKPPGLDRRWWIVAGVALAVVVAGVLGFIVLGDDGDDEPSSSDKTGAPPSLPPPVVGKLDAEGQELVDLLESARDNTYHATYVAKLDPATAGASEQTLEVWRRDGLLREDTRQSAGSGTVETAGFLLVNGQAISCQRVANVDWACAVQATAQSSDGVFGGLIRQIERADVVVTEEEVVGRRARCFTAPSPDGEVSQCVSDDGITLRLRGPGVELLLTELDKDVPHDIFTPPAKPIGSGTKG